MISSRRAVHRVYLPPACITLVVMLGLCVSALAQGDMLRRGISLINASRALEAEQVFRAIGPDNADYPSAQTYLAFLLLQRSALPLAEDAFRNALSLQPGNSSARLGLGITLVHKGVPSEAAKEFEQILTDPFVGLRAQVQWVWSLVYAGRFEEAFREAQLLAVAHPSVAEFQRLLGFLCEIRGDMKGASRAYLESVRLEPACLSTYFSLITLYRSQKDWANALRWAQQALALDENQPVLYRELAAIHESMGQGDAARAARIEAARTYDAEILYTRAVTSGIAGRKGEVEGLLRECTATNPRLSNAWIDLGELLRHQDRFAEASQAFRNALEFSPQDSRASLGLVTALLSEGKEAEAVRYCERFAAQGELSPDLLAAMAAGLSEQGKSQEAAAAMLQAVHKLPDDPDLLSYLGYLQQSSGKIEEALKSYAAALRLNPAQAGALLGQAQSQLSQGEIHGAIASFRASQELDPSNTQIMKGLIQAYRNSGQLPSAESICRACINLDPEDVECREQLAWLRMEAEDYKEAAAQFQLILRGGKSSKTAFDGLAFSLMKTGAYAQAIDLYSTSLKRYGPDARVYANLGFLHRCVGNIVAAVWDYRRARDLAPGDAERNGDLGFALYLARDYPEAVDPLQKALKLKPDWGTGYYNLAMVYWHLGQFRLALSHARKAQEFGVPEAGPVVRLLTANVGQGTPGSVTVRRANR